MPSKNERDKRSGFRRREMFCTIFAELQARVSINVQQRDHRRPRNCAVESEWHTRSTNHRGGLARQVIRLGNHGISTAL